MKALHQRHPLHGGLIHHSDRGTQHVSIKYTEHLALAGIEASVGTVGDSCNNALVETFNGLYKTELIYRRGRWKSFQAVETAKLEWSNGSTTSVCSNPSVTSRPPRSGRNTMQPGAIRYGRMTQISKPPANPGRFQVRGQPFASPKYQRNREKQIDDIAKKKYRITHMGYVAAAFLQNPPQKV